MRTSSSVVPGRATRQCSTGITVSATIESAERNNRSCVSATGPDSELSIGSTPTVTSHAVVASTTAENDGSGRRSPTGTSCSHATELCEPGGPG